MISDFAHSNGPGTVGLPFNSHVLGTDFAAFKPGERVPDQPWFWVILQGRSLVLLENGDVPTLPQGGRPAWLSETREPHCIGFWQGRPLMALAIDAATSLPHPFRTFPFHGPDTRLADRLSTLAGLAGQVLHWEEQSCYCPRCTGEMERIVGTWGKRCLSCRTEHFPHIHPCIIVLIRRGEELLLVRKAESSAGRYSLIAGFLDFGESLEECVQREAREEAGVEVTNIRYVGSQNWPFPSQQMIGFLADYAGGEPRPDGVEVADVRWFTADSLPEAPGSIRSISRWILENHGRP